MPYTNIYHYTADNYPECVATNWDLFFDGNFGRMCLPAGTLAAIDRRILHLSGREHTTAYEDIREAISHVLPDLDDEEISERELRQVTSGYLTLADIFTEYDQ